MTFSTRPFIFTLPALALSCLGAMACSSSNEPSTTGSDLMNGQTGGAPTSSGGSTTSSGGATTSTGNATSSTGNTTGSSSGGSSSKGGAGGESAGGSAGSKGGAAQAGGSTGSGGDGNGTGGSAGKSGAPGTGGGSSEFSPPCGNTAAGVEIAKGGACVAADPQLCYKTCGPINVGFKAETCMASGYDEGTCQFPSGGNYSCFKIPTADDAACPADPPQHNQPCAVPACKVPCGGTACSMCGLSAGYLDSKGNPKTGYCVCIEGSTGNKWSCSSATAWPCPGGQGC